MAFKFVKKILSAVAIISIVSSLTNSVSALSFTGKEPIEENKNVKSFVREISHNIDLTDLLDKDEISSLAKYIVEKANVFSDNNDEIGKFEKASIVRVIDGDTIVVNIDGKGEYDVRLIGINTPESVASAEYLNKTGKENTKEGKYASEFTKTLLINYDFVYLQKDVSDVDEYGRLLRYVWLELPSDEYNLDEIATDMLNGILVKEGIAEVVKYDPDTEYYDEFKDIEDMEY